MAGLFLSCAEALAAPPPAPITLPVLYVVAAALVDRRGSLLVAQRPPGRPMAGFWEFPGGKIDAGETPEYALMRELREELGIETRPCCFTPAGFVSHTYPEFHLIMPLYICRVWQGTPEAKEGQVLKWVKVHELYGIEMPDADKPLIPQLEAML